MDTCIYNQEITAANDLLFLKQNFRNKICTNNLIALFHCTVCGGNCTNIKKCRELKKLLIHSTKCKHIKCKNAECTYIKDILTHYFNCKNNKCDVCVHVHEKIDLFRIQKENYKYKKNMWLLFRHSQQIKNNILDLYHCSKCDSGENCQINKNCKQLKKIWTHIIKCKNNNCNTRNCIIAKNLLTHYWNCKDPKCVICVDVREKIIIK
jgi:hypothetical protein